MQKLLIALVWLSLFSAAEAQKTTFTPQFQVNAQQLKALAEENAAYRPFVPYIKHDVEAFKVIYSTHYKGKSIRVSGTVLIPGKEGPLPLLVFNHGTTFQESLIPSNWPNGVRIEILWATHGFISIIPDYIGYGENSDELHPYMISQYEVDPVTDMVHATRSILAEKDMEPSEQLFISGFSQGGHVTMALLNTYKRSPEIADMSITAATAIGAPTRLDQNLEFILRQGSFNSVGYLGALFSSYNEEYWHRPYSDFFQEPYAGKVRSYSDGKLSMNDMASSLTKNIRDLMNPEFMDAFLGKKERKVKSDLQKNSIKPWNVTTPLLIVHGANDEDVPVTLAQKTAAQLKSKSKKPGIVTFNKIDGADHNASGQLGLIKALEFFESFLDNH